MTADQRPPTVDTVLQKPPEWPVPEGYLQREALRRAERQRLATVEVLETAGVVVTAAAIFFGELFSPQLIEFAQNVLSSIHP